MNVRAFFLSLTLLCTVLAQTLRAQEYSVPPCPAGVERCHFVVALDGSGDFTSIQAAVEAVRDYTPIPWTIFVRPGVYREKVLIPLWKTGITVVGAGADQTILVWDDYSGKAGHNTFTSYTLRVSGNDIRVRDLTVRNDAGPVGQALALFVSGDRVVFDRCRFEGNQDTIFAAGEGARQLFRGCYVEGTTDFIFGPATAAFVGCRIHSLKNSYITAASTPLGGPFGFVFINCEFTSAPGVDRVYLGRPWRDFARTAILRSELGAHIDPAGWHNWSRPAAERTVRYAEYGNFGPGADRAGRVPWSGILTDAEASRYTLQAMFGADSSWYAAAPAVSPAR